jgi:hypothetical protein
MISRFFSEANPAVIPIFSLFKEKKRKGFSLPSGLKNR